MVGLVLLPALAGVVLLVAVYSGLLPRLVWTGSLSVDLAALAAFVGALLSLAMAGTVGLRRRLRRQHIEIHDIARSEQEAERRQFLRRLDHELKNPLLIIRLAAENLHQSSLPLPTEQSESLARLLQQSRRLHTLVEGLRLLAELGEAQVEREQVALADVLAEAVALCSDDQIDPGWVTLSLQQVPWPVGAVRGDRDLLVMAFHNLLDNARKFSGNNGRVEVRASEDGGMAVVEIADTGMGIASTELPYIFDELYRAPNARGVPGSGLGLALVQRIVEMHGGTIGVRSRVDQGTVVTVRLPLA